MNIKNERNSKNAFFVITFVFLLILTAFAGLLHTIITDDAGEIVHADTLEATKNGITVSLSDLPELLDSTGKAMTGDPILIDLSSGSTTWVTDIASSFRLNLSYTSSEVTVSKKGYFNAADGLPTDKFGSQAYSGDDAKEKWTASDSLNIRSDNGATPIAGNHYLNSGTRFAEQASAGLVYEYYCPTHQSRKSSQILYHACRECVKSLTSISLGSNKCAATCSTVDCPNKDSIFITTNQCPACGSGLSGEEGERTCTKQGCTLNGRTFIDYFANTGVYCATCKEEIVPTKTWAAGNNNKYELYNVIEPTDIGNSDYFTLSVSSLKISGTDWTGASVKNKVIYNGTSVSLPIAGIYYISSVTFNLSARIPYYSSYTFYDVDNYSTYYDFITEADKAPFNTWMETTAVTTTATFSSSDFNGLNCTIPEESFPIVCSSHIELNGDSISSMLNNNLVNMSGYVATYEAGMSTSDNWRTRISLYKSNHDLPEGNFTYSSSTRTPFKLFAGIAGSTTIDSANLYQSVNSGRVCDYLDIVWYRDEKLTSEVLDEAIVESNTYYLGIFPKGRDSFSNNGVYYTQSLVYVTYSGSASTTVKIPSILNDPEETDEENMIMNDVYRQVFTVSRKELRLDVVNRYGLELVRSSKSYIKTYSLIPLTGYSDGDTLPSEIPYYTYQGGKYILQGTETGGEEEEYSFTPGQYHSGVAYYYQTGLDEYDEPIYEKVELSGMAINDPLTGSKAYYTYNVETDKYKQISAYVNEPIYVVDDAKMNSAEELFSVVTDITEDTWCNKMNGDASDYGLFNENAISLVGTVYPDSAPGTYNHITLSITVKDISLADNYSVALGVYSDDVWVPFTTSSTGTYLISSSGANSTYYFVHPQNGATFNIVSPPIQIKPDEEVIKSSYTYGEIFDYTELDPKALTLVGEVTFVEDDAIYGDYYSFGSPDWIIKVINDPEDAVSKNGKNVIYIIASFYTQMEFEEPIDDEQKVQMIGQDGFIEKQQESEESDFSFQGSGYYKRYADRLFPLDEGSYYLAYYVYVATEQQVSAVMPCMDSLTAVWDLAADEPTPISTDLSEEERQIRALISFSMEKPYAIDVTKIEVYYNIYEYQQKKHYDGTTTVYAPNYRLAVSTGTDKDYTVGATVPPAADPEDAFYEYNSTGDYYFITNDVTFKSEKKYYLITDFVGDRLCKLELNVSDPDIPFHQRIAKDQNNNEIVCTSVLQYDMSIYFRSLAYVGYTNAQVGVQNIVLHGEETESGELNYFYSIYVGFQEEAKKVMKSYNVTATLNLNHMPSDMPGEILPLELKVAILPDPERITDETLDDYSKAYYSRPFQSCSGVAIRVATYDTKDNATGSAQKSIMDIYKGSNYNHFSDSELLEKPYYADYYYVYYLDDSDKKHIKGYMYYSSLLEFAEENKIKFILLEVKDGFLNTAQKKEGFKWDDQEGFGEWVFPENYVSFNYNPDTGMNDDLTIDNEKDFIYWYKDSKTNAQNGVNGGEVFRIGYDTVCCGSEIEDFYIMHLDYDYKITNYVLSYYNSGAAATETYADYFFTLEITKAILTAEDIGLELRDKDASVGRFLNYNAMSHTSDIVMADDNLSYVTFYEHKELSYFYSYDSETQEFSGHYLISDTWTKAEALMKNHYEMRGWIIDTYTNGSAEPQTGLRGETILSHYIDGAFDFDFVSVNLKKGDYNKDGKFLTVVEFEHDVKDGGTEVVTIITSDIAAFKYAGKYTVQVTVPETENYRSVNGGTFEIVIETADLYVYSTVASRKYMETYDSTREIAFDDTDIVFVESEAELKTYIGYIDLSNGTIYVDEDDVPANTPTYPVYVYHDPYVPTEDNTFQAGVLYYVLSEGKYVVSVVPYGETIPATPVYYVKSTNKEDWTYDVDRHCLIYYGLQHQNGIANNPLETFGINDQYALVQNNVEEYLPIENNVRVDSADIYGKNVEDGKASVIIEISGAFKQNYRFVYPGKGDESSFLYVWAQNLDLHINYHQEAPYSGESVIPEYYITNEEGTTMVTTTIDMYIAAYYYLDESGRIRIVVNHFNEDGSAVASSRDGVFATSPADFDSADAYYYFLDHDEKIYIFDNGTKCFYYENNDFDSVAIDLCDKITFNDTYKNQCINVISGKEIYIWINEEPDASGCTEVDHVIDVYMKNTTKGGYILKVFGKPDEINGGNAHNYRESSLKVIFFDIKTLMLNIDEEQLYVVAEFNGSVYGARSDSSIKFNTFFIKDIEEEDLRTEAEWGWITIESYYYNNRFGTDIYDMSDVDKGKITYSSINDSSTGTWTLKDYSVGDLTSAGWYILFMKAVISDGTLAEILNDDAFSKDMRGNLSFNIVEVEVPCPSTQNPSQVKTNSQWECYFVVFLTRTRGSNFDFSLSAEGLSEVSKDELSLDGIYKIYSKTFDNDDSIQYGYRLTVANRDSSKGEMITVSADISFSADMSNAQSYLLSHRSYEESPLPWTDDLSEVFISERGYFYTLSNSQTYNVASETYFTKSKTYYQLQEAWNEYKGLTAETRLSMKQCNSNSNGIAFYLRFTVNSLSGEYDSNYETKTYIFAIIINKRELYVSVDTKLDPSSNNSEKYQSSKYYGQTNSSVEYKFTFKYDNYAPGDADPMALIDPSEYPVIDWNRDGAITTTSPAGYYNIYAKSGPNTIELQNYTFVYNIATEFVIIRQDPVVVFEGQMQFAGEELKPQITRYGVVPGSTLSESDYTVNLDEKMDGNLDKLDDDDWHIERIGYFTVNGLAEDDNGMFWYTLSDEGERIYTVPERGLFPEKGLLVSAIYSSNIRRAFQNKDKPTYDVGFYMYKVSFAASVNYNGLEETYFLLEVTKAPLTVYFWDSSVNGEYSIEKAELLVEPVARGAATKIYDKDQTIENYPYFEIVYNGFLGIDADNDSNYSVEKIYCYNHSYTDQDINNKGKSELESSLGLINPYYIFINEETGKELVGRYLDDYIYPVDVVIDEDGNIGSYYIMLYLTSSVGVAKNYYIRDVEYMRDNADRVLYPTLTINPRPVIARYEVGDAKVTKSYDGTTDVIPKSVSNDNYSFCMVNDDPKSGLIQGDDILLDVNYNDSRYARKNVYEEIISQETGENVFVKTDIVVTIIAAEKLLGEQRNNYRLIFETDDSSIVLKGQINQVKATVEFYKDSTMTSQERTRISVIYNGEEQSVTKVVHGVPIRNDQKEIIGYEEIRYTERYYSTATGYDKPDPPINCSTYTYEITVLNVVLEDYNYAPEPSNIELLIDLAEVSIHFYSDAVQTYGDIGLGLTAVAYGVGDYSLDLEVVYFTSFEPRQQLNDAGEVIGEIYDVDCFKGMVSNITKADAGVYYARAVYTRTTNFRDNYAYEEFTIAPREALYSAEMMAEEYPYTGSPIEADFYIVYEETRIKPSLILFDSIDSDGNRTPFNYKVVDGVISDITQNYPVNAGSYSVRPHDRVLSNFIIINSSSWHDFRIVPVDVTISVEKTTITEGETYYPTYSIVKSTTKEDFSSLLRNKVTLRYYDAKTGKQLDDVPHEAGEYKIIPNQIVMENYNIYSTWGSLTINKKEVVVSVAGMAVGETAPVFTFDGSFPEDFRPEITKLQNVADSDVLRRFNSYKEMQQQSDEEFNFFLSSVYMFSFDNTSTIQNSTGFTIKCAHPELVAMLKQQSSSSAQNSAPRYAFADDGKYYVCVFYNNSEKDIDIVEAYISENDEIVFDVQSADILAISVLSRTELETTESDDLGWLLYLFIGLGVLAIGLSLLLVLKKKG